MRISTKSRRRLASFALLAGSILISLSAGEAATRWILGRKTVLYPRNFTAAHYHGVTLRRLIPNARFWHTSVDGSWEFRTNAQGFRDDANYEYQKPVGQRRVLVLGDSQTQGFEVHQTATFAKQLERRLRADGVDAQILNTDISGFGTAEELMSLEHEGMKYRPDAIVVAFFDNDFDDSVNSGLYELKDGQLVVQKTSYTPGVKPIAVINAVPGGFWLSQNSYLFSVLLNTVWEAGKKALRVTARQKLTTEYAVRVSEVNDYEGKLAVALLRRMRAVANSADIPLIVVEIPGIAPDTSEAAWLPSVPRDLVPAMTASCDAYIPPGAYLAEARKGSVQVPHGQRHISEQTHARIAEILEKTLRQTSSRFLLQTSSSESARGQTTSPDMH